MHQNIVGLTLWSVNPIKEDGGGMHGTLILADQQKATGR